MPCKSIFRVIISLAISLCANANEIVTTDDGPQSQRFDPQKLSGKSALRDLFRCADGLADHWFSENGETLLKWQAEASILATLPKYPPIAVTFFQGGEAPSFLTVTPDQVFTTPAHPHVDSPGVTGSAREFQIVLNLIGQMDPKRNLPIVDRRDAIAPSWFHSFRVESGRSGPSIYFHRYRQSDLVAPYSEVRGSDALTGTAADATMLRIAEILVKRLRATPKRVEEIFRRRQASGARFYVPNLPGSSDRAISRRSVDFNFLFPDDVIRLQRGLCSCEGTVNGVEEIRKRLTAPDYPVRFWRNNGPQKIAPEDLSCGMV